jgi:mannose-6-phosphate isomerase
MSVYPLTGVIRPYAWGSHTAIAELQGRPAPTEAPEAELWLGAHPDDPSTVGGQAGGVSLDSLIAGSPKDQLGEQVMAEFGPRLPYLLKILAAGQPLSLQAHPSLEYAREAFARQQADPSAPRNYTDANHKPEMLVALTPFEALCGFRAPTAAADAIDALAVPALDPVVKSLRDGDLRGAVETLLSWPQDDRAPLIDSVVAAATAHPGDDACALAVSLAGYYPGDPGVLVALLLNHVRLQPGEALFLGAGIPHAYLNGLGVEIMANSDNVLRCGLTPKHVDVPELLRIVRFEASDPGVLRPEASPDGEEVYETPIDEFRLSRYVLPEGGATHDLTRETPQILLCTAGTVRADGHELRPGRSVFVPAGEKAEVSGSGTIFRATVIV